MTDQRSAKRYFAAANTHEGFISFFNDIFFGKKIEKRYIIKGGPGTGKSSFLRRIALDAHKHNRDVEYYYCSSDTDSLDGIVIDGSIALFDGTYPHSYDTVLPGAVDEIINLGDFWDVESLQKNKSEIHRLSIQKSNAYAYAYGYLRAAGELERTIESVIEPCVKTEKMRSAVTRMISKLGIRGNKGERQLRQTSALGIKGHVRFNTLEINAKQKFYVEDYYGTASRFLEEFANMAIAAGARVDISLDVPFTKRISELYLPDTDYYFRATDKCQEDALIINMKRFIDTDALADVRFSYRTAKQAKDKITDLASQSLVNAGEIHSKIEGFYVSSMDFSRLKAFCTQFSQKL